MAKGYTATIEARAWKEHACCNCGATFTYLLSRKVTGQGGTADKAQVNAAKAAEKAILEQVDVHPCPTCGLVQPDMVGQQRAVAHIRVFLASLVLLIAVLILRLAHMVRSDELTLYTTVATLAIAAVHAFVEFRNPNRDIAANRKLAEARVADGTLRHVAGQDVAPSAEHCSPSKGTLHRMALPLLALSVILTAAPEALRVSRGWPVSTEAYPPVVGPGDTTRVYMDHKFSSVKGYWRGQPNVVLETPSGKMSVNATTNDSRWSGTISYKSREKANSSTPWVELHLPDNPALANQSVTAFIKLTTERPVVVRNSYEEVREIFERTVPLKLAPAHAGASYNSLWWEGTMLGVGVLILSGLVLRGAAKELRKRAVPTRVTPVGA